MTSLRHNVVEHDLRPYSHSKCCAHLFRDDTRGVGAFCCLSFLVILLSNALLFEIIEFLIYLNETLKKKC